MPTPIRIMLVDDHELVLDTWQLLLEADRQFKVIAQCKNGHDAIEQAHKLLPDIILMDLNMSPLDGYQTTKRIIERNPSQKIIGASVNNDPWFAAKLFSMGAKGYVTKTSPLDEIKTAILKVYKGESYICEEVRRKSPGKK